MLEIKNSLETCKGIILSTINEIDAEPKKKHFTNLVRCHLQLLFENFYAQMLSSVNRNHQKLAPFAQSTVQQNLVEIQTTIKYLKAQGYFQSTGNNFPYMAHMNKVSDQFGKIIELLKKNFPNQSDLTFLKIQSIPNDIFMYLPQYTVEMIDSYAKEVQELLKNGQKNVDEAVLKCLTSELGMIFWVKYYKIENSVNWSDFIQKFKEFLQNLEKNLISSEQEQRLRDILDDQGDGIITPEIVDLFFNLSWCNPTDRNQVFDLKYTDDDITKSRDNVSTGTNLTATKVKQQTLIQDSNFSNPLDQIAKPQSKPLPEGQHPNLLLKVIGIPDNTFFKLNQEILITPKGYEIANKADFRDDGQVLFGRKAQDNNNLDLYFHEKDLMISRKQISIVYKKDIKKYCIQCTSGSNPTLFKIHNFVYELTQGSIFQLAQGQFFHVKTLRKRVADQESKYDKTIFNKTLKTPNDQSQINTYLTTNNDVSESTLRKKKRQYDNVQNFCIETFEPTIISLPEGLPEGTVITQKGGGQAEQTVSGMIYQKANDENAPTIKQPHQEEQKEITLKKGKQQGLYETTLKNAAKQAGQQGYEGQQKTNVNWDNQFKDEISTDTQPIKKETIQIQRDPNVMLDSEVYMELEILKGEFDKQIIKYKADMNEENSIFRIGRGPLSQFKLTSNSISTNHCQIVYNQTNNFWGISERLINEQASPSSNGTFLFLKNYQQYKDKKPSSSFPLEKNMIVSIEGTNFQVINC